MGTGLDWDGMAWYGLVWQSMAQYAMGGALHPPNSCKAAFPFDRAAIGR